MFLLIRIDCGGLPLKRWAPFEWPNSDVNSAPNSPVR